MAIVGLFGVLQERFYVRTVDGLDCQQNGTIADHVRLLK